MRNNTPAKSSAKMASGLNLLLGLWLIIAPFIFSYATAAASSNDLTIGVTIAILALIRVFKVSGTSWASWVNVALGVWLLVAPFVLRYADPAALWNDLIVGIAVICLGIWSAGVSRGPRRPIE